MSNQKRRIALGSIHSINIATIPSHQKKYANTSLYGQYLPLRAGNAAGLKASETREESPE
jgi:hypothetical protein